MRSQLAAPQRALTALTLGACLAVGTVSSNDADAMHQREFFSWLAEGGATIHPSLSLRQGATTGVRGLHTDEPLAVDTELAYVPRALWLDDSTAANSAVGPLLGKIREQTSRLPQHTSLLIFLVHEKLIGTQSLWARYFDWLPQAYHDLPTSWSDRRRNAMLAAVPRGIVEWIAHEHWSYSETEFDCESLMELLEPSTLMRSTL